MEQEVYNLAQPVIRAIDGHLKMILLNFEIIPDWKYIKVNGYDMFEKVGAKYRLCSDRYGKATILVTVILSLIVIEINYPIGKIQQHLWIQLTC